MISAWLLYFLVYQLLSKVDAQTSCVIRPDLSALAIRIRILLEIELHCQCMDDNGMIITGTSWFHDGVSVSDTVNDPNLPTDAPSILRIASGFDNSDSGTYTCSPNSTFPTVPPGDNITLTTGTPTTNQRTCNIISTSLPTLTTPSGVIADGTEDVILYCICLTNDDIAVGPTRWFINSSSTPIPDTSPNGNNPYFRNNVPSPLIIPMFGASNVGTYRCGSDNTIAAPDDDRITLTLAFAPSINPEVMDETRDEGESASFTCQATSGPAPTINWYFNSTLLASGAKYTISETSVNTTTISSTLAIMSVESSDVGTYTCNATNVVSTDTSSGVLTVNVAPNITTPMEGLQFNIIVGSNRSITCTATGYPVPTVVWQNSDGSSLSNNRLVSGPVNMSSTGVGNETSVSVELMVIGTMRVDTGIYRCSANNSVRNITRNISISVQFDAQTSCVIRPNLTTLAIRDGLMQDIELHCQCMDGNGMTITETSWFHNGSSVTTTVNDTNLPTGAPSIVFIAGPFNGTGSGTYTCSPDSTFLTLPPENNITLTIGTPTTNQRTCNIISTSLPTVTTPSGVIANGTEDVILYCICLTNDDDIAVGPTRWFIDNTEVTDDLPNGNNPYFRNNVPSPLIIPMFGASNVGTYRCGSDNTIAAPDDDRITLTLAFAPTITTPMEGLQFNITEGRNGSITCTATGYPVPTVLWQNSDGSSLSNNRLVSGPVNVSSTGVGNETSVSVELMVIGAMREDTGMYRCSANNSVSSTSRNINIIVQYSPIINPEVMNQTQDEEQSVSFTCQATGIPVPTIRWYFNGTPVDVTNTMKYTISEMSVNSTTISSTLTIMSVESSDVGTYTCNATNVVSNDTSSGVLTVNVAPTITIPMEGQQFNITEGRNGSITCTATGYPVPTVVWQNIDGSSLSDNRLVSGSPVNMSSTGVGNETSVSVELMVIGAMRVDTGMYRCSANNSVDSTSRNITITVQYGPSIIGPMNQTINEGGIASFNCQADGEPLPTISWYFNGVALDDSNTAKYMITERLLPNASMSVLNIMDVESSDSGTYTCNATNVVSTDSSSGVLIVNVSPIITTLMEGQQQLDVIEGRNGSITCTATGYPAPTVVWQNSDGSSLNNNRLVSGPVNMLPTGVGNEISVSVELKVIGAIREDDRMYRCSANNIIGNTTANIRIIIQFGPSTTPVTDQTENEGGTATFVCEADGVPIPIFSWYFNGVLLDDSNTNYDINSRNDFSILVITSVNSLDVGTYTCNATNVVSSNNSSGVLTVNVTPIITTPMEGQQFNITEGRNGSITCTATGYPVPTVLWQNSDGSSLSNNRLVSGSPVNMSSTGVGNVTSVSVELMVIGATRVDTEMYRCSANNIVSGITSTTSNININVQFAPEIIIPSNSITVINGSEVVLNCTVAGSPLPAISWFVASGVNLSTLISNGVRIPFDEQGRINESFVNNTVLNSTTIHSSMRLPETAPFVAGEYACRASNYLRSINRTATLTVYVPPTVVTPNGSRVVTDEGTSLLVDCTAAGIPPPNITWKDPSGTELPNDDNMRIILLDHTLPQLMVVNRFTFLYHVTRTLVINNANDTDTGNYTCIADNGIMPVDNNTAEVFVRVPPVVIPQIPFVIGGEGNSTVLRFFVINAFPPFTVRWSLNREGIITDITNNTMVDNNTLTFEIESNSTTQIYSLTISNIQPSYTSRFNLTVSNPAGADTNYIDLIVEGPPDILVGPTGTIEIDDSNVTLVCNAIAYPQHNVTWMFHRTNASNAAMIINTSSPDPTMKYLINDDVNSISFGTLTITNLQYSDRGVYACIAANVHGTVSASAMVSVQVKPTNDMISGGGRVNISSPVNLTCTVIGVPLPAIVWQLNGNDIKLPSKCVENSYNASLDFGSEFESPNCRINQTLNLLDDVVASAVSDPQDIITLGMYDLSQLVVESTLMIRLLERSDNGSYTCNVTNMLPGASIVTNSTPTVVLERPEPVRVSVEDQGSHWVHIRWDAPYNGNSEIDGYIVYLKNINTNSDFIQVSTSAGGIGKRQLSSQLTTTSTSYNITEGILPSMQYQFTAVACNQLGCGEFGEPSQTVQTDEDLNTAFFQIRLRPIGNCEEWTEDDKEQKLRDIKEEVTQEIVRRCSCVFNPSNIVDDSFSCRRSQGEFRNTVVYRARIILEVPSFITNANNIVTMLNEWVESEPSVRVDGSTLDIDSNCPTMLDSFKSSDCEVPTEGTKPSPSSSTGIIIGAAVAAAVVVLFLITAVVIITMYRRHKSSYRVTEQHEHVYDHVETKALPTRIRDHPLTVKKSTSNDNDIVMDANPAYGVGFRTASKTIKAGDDGEYETVDTQTRQVKAADITMVNNPAYAETTFT